MTKQVTLFLFFLICFAEAKVELCNFSFLANSQEDPSTLFISYLDFLNEKKVLDIDEFEEVLVRLESGELINPFEAKEVNKENESYGRVFQDYINIGIDEQRIKSHLETIVQRERQTARETNKTKEEVKDLFFPLKFEEVIAGSSQGEFGIDYSFEMMITPVTRAHWKTIFEKTILVEDMEELDLPQIGINFLSQSIFADLLSQSKNLEPVYKINFLDPDYKESAYKGNLRRGNDIDRWLILSRNDLHLSEGYRLPTRNEQLLMLQKAVDFIGQDVFRDKLGDYAYLSHNSFGQLQPVATKKPYLFNNTRFYDIIGNVRENLFDSKHVEGIYSFHSNMGGFNDNLTTYSQEVDEHVLNTSRTDTGLRLVRTLKK